MTSMTSAPAAAGGYRAIAAEIVRRVALGELAPGARLPPVRQAAALWGVNLNTVQRAYAHLAAQGIVETHGGGGTRVAAAPADQVATARALRLRALLGESVGTALGLGYTPSEVEAAFVGQLAQWREARARLAAEPRAARATGADGHLGRGGGSHDLSLELLAGRLRGAAGVTLHLQMSSSLGGLFALAG